jgi:hypothetical protein
MFLRDKSVFLTECLLILPSKEKTTPDQQQLLNLSTNSFFKSEEIENIRILNPKLDRKIRQEKYAQLAYAIWFYSRHSIF